MVRDAAKYLFYQIQLKLTWVHRWPRIGPKASSGPGHGTWKRTRNTDKDTEQEHGSGAGANAELKPKLTLHKGV